MSQRESPPHDLPSRIGKIMLLSAWILGLALLGLLFQRFIDAEQNPNRHLQVTVSPSGASEVILKRNRAGHYVVPGQINGVPATFLVDTGASAVALPVELARKLRLPLRPGGSSMTANGVASTWTTHLDSLSIGGLVARDIDAVVMPNMPGTDVLLGMSFLRRVELLQRGDTLTLRAPR